MEDATKEELTKIWNGFRSSMDHAENRKKEYAVAIVESVSSAYKDINAENKLEAVKHYNYWRGQEASYRDAAAAMFRILEQHKLFNV